MKTKMKLASEIKDSKFNEMPSGYFLSSKEEVNNKKAGIVTMNYGDTPFGQGKVNMENMKLVAGVGQSLFKEFVMANPEKAKSYTESFGIKMEVQEPKAISLMESIGGKISMRENYMTFKEDGLDTTSTDSLYVKFLHDTVYGDIGIEIEKYMRLVNVNEDLMKKTGFGSIKIPKIYPGIASVLAEDGEIIYFGDNTDDLEITCKVRAIGTKLTWHLMKRGLDGVVKLMMRFSANALVRRIGSDIVNTLAAGATGSETGGISYDNIVDARADVNAAKYNSVPYTFSADKLVIDVVEFATLQKTDDYKQHVFRATIIPSEKTGIVNRPVQYFGDLEIVEVNLMDTSVAKALVLDSKFAGIFVKESDYMTFERDLPNTFGTKEIVLGMSYGIGVLFGAAISKITE
jgi:hypothetical protein